jgi:hypothetical protein
VLFQFTTGWNKVKISLDICFKNMYTMLVMMRKRN